MRRKKCGLGAAKQRGTFSAPSERNCALEVPSHFFQSRFIIICSGGAFFFLLSSLFWKIRQASPPNTLLARIAPSHNRPVSPLADGESLPWFHFPGLFQQTVAGLRFGGPLKASPLALFRVSRHRSRHLLSVARAYLPKCFVVS
jgi:hypothetical protein